MLYHMEKVGSPNVNFSDYVTSIGSIPYKTNNIDKTIIFEGYDFELSSECPYEIESGDKILVYRNDTLVHVGLVESKTFDEKKLTYRVLVSHLLAELKKRNSDLTRQSDGLGGYKTFLDVLLENSTETTIGTLDFDMISFKELIDLLINEAEDAGVTVDWSNTDYFNEPDFIWRCYEVGDSTLTEIDSPEVDSTELYFLAQQLNCTGVNGIFAQEEFTDEMKANKPSLFDILVQVCVLLGVNFIPKTATSFYATIVASDMPGSYLSDDEIFSIQTEDEIIKATGVEATYGTLRFTNWFNTSIPEYDPGTEYFNGDYVTYNGQIYRATFGYYNATEPETGGIIGTSPEDPFYWYLTSIDPEVLAYISPVSQDGFVQYEHRWGVRCENLQWMDNFNPIIINSGDSYFAIPVVNQDNSCAKYLKNALVNSIRKTNIVCPAEKIIDVALYEFDSIYIDDINLDAVEIEINERIV